jgi:hypothetical protein
MLRAAVAACLLGATNAMSFDRLAALLAKDPEVEAHRAFSSGDRSTRSGTTVSCWNMSGKA